MYLVYIVTVCNRAGHHILVLSECPEGVLVYQGMTDVLLPMFGHLGCLSIVNVLNRDFNSLVTYSDTEEVNHRVIILQFLKNLHTILEVTVLSYTPTSSITRYKATFSTCSPPLSVILPAWWGKEDQRLQSLWFN